jgi:hypothetical protein
MDFFAPKIRRLRPVSWIPEASMLTTRPPKPLRPFYELLLHHMCVCVCVRARTLVEVWCVARNLQLDGFPLGWCQWTLQRFGAATDMWFNTHSVVHKVWLINCGLHTMHDAYVKNICCVVYFGKWKQIISAGEEFYIVAFFVFKRSRFLEISALAPNTELQHDSNIFWAAGINVVSTVAGAACIRFEYHNASIYLKTERRSRYHRDWILYTELGKTAPDILTPSLCPFRLGFLPP